MFVGRLAESDQPGERLPPLAAFRFQAGKGGGGVKTALF